MGLNYQQLCAECGVTYHWFRKVLNGTRKPSESTAIKLAAALTKAGIAITANDLLVGAVLSNNPFLRAERTLHKRRQSLVNKNASK